MLGGGIIFKSVAILLLGGMAELERTSVFHGIFSEPIILCPVIGYILGFPMLGLKVGIVLQLFFIGGISIGGSSPPDATMASVAVTFAASLAASFPSIPMNTAISAAVLISMAPAGFAGKLIYSYMKESNVKLLHDTEEALEKNGIDAIDKAVRKSLIRTFSVFTLAIGIVTALSATATCLLLLYVLPSNWHRPLEVSAYLLLLASAGVALASLKEKRAIWVYAGVGVGLLVLMSGSLWLW